MLSTDPILSNPSNLLSYNDFKDAVTRSNYENYRQNNRNNNENGGFTNISNMMDLTFSQTICDQNDLSIIEQSRSKSEKIWFQMTIDQFKEYIPSEEYRDQVRNTMNHHEYHSKRKILIINDFNQFEVQQQKSHNQLFQDYLYQSYNNRNVNDFLKSYKTEKTLLLSDYLDNDIINHYLLQMILHFNLQIFIQFHESERGNVKSFSSFSKSIEKAIQLNQDNQNTLKFKTTLDQYNKKE
ncbi:hypothetical protein ACTA71_009220 [Dictyostelium dimigraforme]